jgi:hypothetical protein
VVICITALVLPVEPGLTSIDAAKNDDINRIRCTLSPQHRYVTAGAQVISISPTTLR